ncbi:uncharacterized protein LOC119349816 isoform X1 [Triticum dicoccoides]|uniref:uncharacterized protein LOC119349816 isoform X1 n=1 Tax=Triticum dicoccoides TaxID=85692 RepID=UPI00188FA786|nr:uncharacterized protein LOC119349816 isoform X1 [Triticum dicoccoides]
MATLRPATADALVSPRSATTSPTRQGTAWTLGLGLPPLLGGSTSVATGNYVLSLMHVWLKPFYFLQSSHKSVNLRSGQMEGAILLELTLTGEESMTAVFVRLTVQKLLMKHKTSHVEPRADMV